MSRWASLATVVALGFLLAGCGGAPPETGPPSLDGALLSTEDLPSGWQDHEPPQDEEKAVGFCGEPIDSSLPEPTEEASESFGVDPDHGPLFGQRIERYAPGDADQVLEASKALALPCEWEEDGTNWRATREPAFDLGDDGRVYLITNLDRPDSFNYEVAVRSGDVLSLAVLNVRTADRPMLDDLIARAWEESTGTGITRE